MKTCTTCSREHDRDADLCFGCHIKGVGFSFVGGGGYGRKNFHERTTAEVVREATFGRKDVEFVGRTPYYGPAT